MNGLMDLYDVLMMIQGIMKMRAYPGFFAVVFFASSLQELEGDIDRLRSSDIGKINILELLASMPQQCHGRLLNIGRLLNQEKS